jgi:hypothetical protein
MTRPPPRHDRSPESFVTAITCGFLPAGCLPASNFSSLLRKAPAKICISICDLRRSDDARAQRAKLAGSYEGIVRHTETEVPVLHDRAALTRFAPVDFFGG